MDRKNLLMTFVTHPVAMNILMAVFLITGIYVISRINIQFFPDIQLDYVSVQVPWPGASAEDVERSVTNTLELELKNTDNLKNLHSNSTYSNSQIYIEFELGTDISDSVDNVKSTVERLIPELPNDIDRPIVTEVINSEGIAKVLISGSSLDQLRILANRSKDELLDKGIGKVEILGLPEEEISIQISGHTLRELGLSLNQIGDRVRSHSHDASIGILGRNDAGRELRVIDQRRTELSFGNIPVIADSDGRLVTLSDIATIRQQPKTEQYFLQHKGKPAVILFLRRQTNGDTLENARLLYEWLDETRPNLTDDVELSVFDDSSIALQDRIDVLLENGVLGLILVLIVLYLFLNTRVAVWVAAGIPVSLMGAVTMLYLLGGSLNMLTLFAFIMTIGIIVDDAIVVGEESLTNYVEKSVTGASGVCCIKAHVPANSCSFTDNDICVSASYRG